MEWQEDFEETDVHHRHCSHLWGLCPGSEIDPGTPELYRGARLALERRGDASTGWSMAWKANFWARLHDGDRAEQAPLHAHWPRRSQSLLSPCAVPDRR